ncbi:MAG TPA: protein-L-isoaspartate O-methyltransferase [Candidatus Saccharimonadia bacterium]|nr:protein-L-isoaspartate O-methyltransferase [Candidatus Saccharimonadia bacterium]
MSLDFERARFNMIEQQVRPWDVLDARVLDVLRTVKREDFVPARYRKMAFADLALPVDGGERPEVMMKPTVEGRMLQALDASDACSILEVGTGSGFVTACLAQLGREVTSIDIEPRFVERAAGRLALAGISNVRLEAADALSWKPARQFDVVCITGAVAEVPESFRSWVRVGGRMFVVRGVSPAMDATLLTRVSETDYSAASLFETDIPYLVNAAPPKRFVL